MTKKIKKLGFFEKNKVLKRSFTNIPGSAYRKTQIEYPSEDKIKITTFVNKKFEFQKGDTLKKIENDISKLINRKVLVTLDIPEEKPEKKPNEQKESSLKKGLKIFSEAWKEADKINEAKQERKKYEEVNNPKKKGGLFTFLAGGAVAGAAKNKISPPIVVSENPEYVVAGMKPVGLNSWQVQYSKRSSLNSKSSFIVQRSRGGSTVSSGGTKFRVFWSG